MEFKVSDLLNLAPLQNAIVLGGERFLNNDVSGITIMEGPDIVEWIKGGEVILTSLYSIRSFNDKEQIEFIESLARKKVSALVIKNLDTDISNPLVGAAEQLGMPVIQMSKEIPFIDVMYPVMGELFNRQVKKLQYYKEIHDRFTEISLADKGIDSIIATLSDLIGNPVALFDRNFHCIVSTVPYLETFELVEKVHFYEETINIKYPHYRQIVKYQEIPNQKSHQIVVPLETINHIKTYLLIGEINKSLEELDFIAVENSANALSLELVKQFAVSEVEKKFKNDLVDELISGKIRSMQSIYEKANVISWDFEGSFVAVLFKIHPLTETSYSKESNKSNLLDRSHAALYDAVNHYLPGGIITNKGNMVTVLWKVKKKNEHDDKSWRKGVQKTAANIQHIIEKQIQDVAVQVGIGNVAESIIEISKSYKEAQDALDVGEKLNGQKSITAFAELGIFRLLSQFDDPQVLTQFIPQSLQRLLEYPQSNRTDLLITLQTFLECQQNASKTAKVLFIHYKSVMYRLDRIKEITGINFDDSEETLSVQVGLKIINFLKREREK
ncbi:PucR family transcriptional regulator ligand-binding domain-containing protein [Rummeliibacillus sp. TYF-LIM-RU47]|uniref:PucR family transcriptional regulator n=1 Tax=Rummeliibacillus sp. TYF-LIM-RU47 TaxID=2608406 RepID=UPI00123AF7B2|nr:PucR family transcriptional regulator ligand-binding domain-containing protein [Rummeliibacillus sp. TYF-LIM-RU47]